MLSLNYTENPLKGMELAKLIHDTLNDAIEASRSTISLELVANNKKLTDAEVELFTSALAEGLTGEVPAFKLKKLVLAGNEMTAMSLPLLARVVKLSKGDIKFLKLSDNPIQIASDEAVENWENFLDELFAAGLSAPLVMGPLE